MVLDKSFVITIAVCVPVIAILLVSVIVVSVLLVAQQQQDSSHQHSSSSSTEMCQDGKPATNALFTIDWQSSVVTNGILSGDGSRFFYLELNHQNIIYMFKPPESGGSVTPEDVSLVYANGYGKYPLTCSYDGGILASYTLEGTVGTLHITTMNDPIFSTQTLQISPHVKYIGGICTSNDGEDIAVSVIYTGNDPDDRSRQLVLLGKQAPAMNF